MATRNYGNDLLGLAAHIDWLIGRMERAEEITKANRSNPLYEIIELAAENILPIYKSYSPYDTGTLERAHRKGASGFEVGNQKLTAWAEIDIDPDPTIINPKYGGYPGDYGPRYHRERRPWFLEALPIAQARLDEIAREGFSFWIDTWAF